MTRTQASIVAAVMVCAGGFGLRAAARQDRTAQPGQPTQGRVWIENRGDSEAVPISIERLSRDAPPLRVQVVGNPGVVQMRAAKQAWEYQEVTIASGQSPASLMNTAGADGWEATGIAVPVQGGLLVVMKRPR
jgi:hypothetical protein